MKLGFLKMRNLELGPLICGVVTKWATLAYVLNNDASGGEFRTYLLR